MILTGVTNSISQSLLKVLLVPFLLLVVLYSGRIKHNARKQGFAPCRGVSLVVPRSIYSTLEPLNYSIASLSQLSQCLALPECQSVYVTRWLRKGRVPGVNCYL